MAEFTSVEPLTIDAILLKNKLLLSFSVHFKLDCTRVHQLHALKIAVHISKRSEIQHGTGYLNGESIKDTFLHLKAIATNFIMINLNWKYI